MKPNTDRLRTNYPLLAISLLLSSNFPFLSLSRWVLQMCNDLLPHRHSFHPWISEVLAHRYWFNLHGVVTNQEKKNFVRPKGEMHMDLWSYGIAHLKTWSPPAKARAKHLKYFCMYRSALDVWPEPYGIYWRTSDVWPEVRQLELKFSDAQSETFRDPYDLNFGPHVRNYRPQEMPIVKHWERLFELHFAIKSFINF